MLRTILWCDSTSVNPSNTQRKAVAVPDDLSDFWRLAHSQKCFPLLLDKFSPMKRIRFRVSCLYIRAFSLKLHCTWILMKSHCGTTQHTKTETRNVLQPKPPSNSHVRPSLVGRSQVGGNIFPVTQLHCFLTSNRGFCSWGPYFCLTQISN